jgi:hypothetical protein
MNSRHKIKWAVALLALGIALAAQGADFNGWSRKAKIQFSGYNPPGGATALTNFPALVVLSTNIPGFAYGDFLSLTNQDLRFTASNGTDELNYEIEKWNTNGSSYVWVQVPRLADTNTSVWAWWGKADTNAPAYTTNGATWSNGYAAVWHLGEAGTGTRADSASTNPATPVAFSGNEATNGVMGGAVNLNVTNSLDCGRNIGNFALANPFTLSVWVNSVSNGANQGIYGNADGNAPYAAGYHVRINNTGRSIRFLLLQSGSVYVYSDSSTLAAGWRHVTCVWPGTSPAVIYVDGVRNSSAGTPGGTLTTITTTNSTRIGSIIASQAGSFNGGIDEMTVATVARSSNWVWAAYMNAFTNGAFAGSFNQYGPVELIDPNPPVVANQPAVNIRRLSADLVGSLTYTGTSPTTVYAFWATNDCTTNEATWIANGGSSNLGPRVQGETFTNSLGGLAPETLYYFNFMASNTSAKVWGSTAGSPSFQTVLATGGNTTNDSGVYRIHTFTNSATAGNFVANVSNVVEVLVVAGGGGGGQTIGGGGGAGGLVSNAWYAVTAGTYTVSVGAGGLGCPTNGSYTTDGGTKGNNSIFASLIAYGGGGGGSYNNTTTYASEGGSGGGRGAYSGSNGAAGTNNQGNAGGKTTANSNSGSGGGGAGTVGSNAISGVEGAGGAGLSSAISGTLTFYAGGGGGGARNPSGGNGGAGGSGVGGAGSKTNGANASANTGGGGGGGGYLNTPATSYAGGNGGSGIVIVRYILDSNLPIVANQPAVNLRLNSADLVGSLTSTGTSPTTVYAFWATNDCTTNEATWIANGGSSNLGTRVQGETFTNSLSGLAPDTLYYFNFMASNTTGKTWGASAGSPSFQTLEGNRIWANASGTGDWFTAANWSPSDNYPQPGEWVVITYGLVLLTNSTANLASLSITNASLLFTNWSTCLTASNVTIKGGGTVTLPSAFTNGQMSNRVWVVCTNFTLNAGGTILADVRGFARENGQAPGANGGYNGGGGGGYGGKGGSGNGGGAGLACGSTNMPMAPGSGGGDGANATTGQGGNGGGAVRIDASGTVTIDGTVTANGGNGANGGSTYRGGGGSGGAIYITCGTFGGTTNGFLRANGGDGSATTGGGGGGGRIAVDYTSVSAVAGVRFSANRGTGWINLDVNAPAYTYAPQVGTLSFPNSSLLDCVLSTWDGTVSWLNGYVFLQATNVWMPGRLVLSNCTVGIPDGYGMRVTNDLTLMATGGVVVAVHASLVCNGNLLMTNGASLVAYGGETNAVYTNYGALVWVTNTLTVASNCWIYPFSQSTNGGSVLFRVGNASIRSGGGINATGRGYIRTFGKGKGTTAGSSSGGSGGGNGGKGGNGSGAGGGTSYGSTNAPTDPGSGGGDGYNANGAMGGHGGGVVRIEATGDMTIDGAVDANGENGRINTSSYQSGGGSGGAIFMMCETFGGAGGRLEAKGGNGGGTLGGSGGGGRISVAIGLSTADRAKLIAGQEVAGLQSYLQEPAFGGTISVTNGTGWTNFPPGGAAMGSQQFLKVQGANQRSVTIDGTPGQYGAPSTNGYSTWTVGDGTTFTNTVATPANELNGMRWSCLGWRLTDTLQGTPITSEGTTQAVFTVNTNVTLMWRWTNEYRLAFAPGPNGAVNSNLLNGWYTNGTPVTTIEATPDPGYYFVAWIGADVPGGPATSNPLTVPMDRARTNITATFASQAGLPITWTGTGNWMSFTNWSPPGVPGSNDTVLVQTGTVTLSEAYRMGSLVVSNGATLVFTSWTTCLTASNVTVLSNGVMTLPAAFTEAQMSNRIWVVCENFTLHTGGRLLADARGYAGVNGQGKGTSSGVTGGGGGGGYGGKGGNGTVGGGGNPYGSTNAPLDPGSGGGHGYTAGAAAGGAGGGAVRIEAAGVVTIDGTVTANGGNGANNSPYFSGGGSGGSIYMTCGTFSGGTNGIMRAKGGANGGGAGTGGGAGGGRIAVWVGLTDAQKEKAWAGDITQVTVDTQNRNFLGTLSSINGTGYTNSPPGGAGPGTVLFLTPLSRGTIFVLR